MTLKQTVYAVLVLISTFSDLAMNVRAQSNSKKSDSPVVVGTLKSVDSSGTKFEIKQESGSLRELYLDSKSKVYFVGLSAKGERQPKVGQGVKAASDKDGCVKTISFTPSVGKTAMLGENRLKMTESELFNEIDRDGSSSISYVEFSKYIYHSPKHGPDSFRKADKDSDGLLNTTEFCDALSKVPWWRISRRTPNEWFTQADVDRDGILDINEFSVISTSGNHIENVFRRTDGDKSGSLSEGETETYIRSITHGNKKSRGKRKRD